jgi:hypothetical protein
MQKLKIDVSKIDKRYLFKGSKGTYLDVTLMENKDGPDQYGNDGFIVQDIGKEAREAGEKGNIIGNWRHLQKRTAEKPEPVAKKAVPKNDDVAPDDIPF